MSTKAPVKVDEKAVRDIISSRSVTTFFQPVVSVTSKSIVGFEAYSRGGNDACAIETSQLFHDDLSWELKVDVDRLCRAKALAQFKSIHANHKGLFLFLNVNPDILPHVKTADAILPAQAKEAGINFGQIMVECRFDVQYMDQIMEYAEVFKKLGFSICLDGLNVDHGFSHVLSKIKPDMVKINRSFFGGDERKEYSAKTLEALLAVAERVGSAVVGQRVETEDESLRLLAAGVHLQQGYYYTKDENAKTGDPAKMFFQKIFDTHEKYKQFKKELVRRKKERFGASFRNVTSVCSKFANMSEDQFEAGCKAIVSKVDEVISVFVVDEVGEQITSRVHRKTESVVANAAFVLGSPKGADHSVEDYVLYLDMGYDKFVTPPFVSPYTGENACIISKSFFSQDGLRYTLCVEMPYPG